MGNRFFGRQTTIWDGELAYRSGHGIKAFFETASRILVNLPTGSSKSLIYQTLPNVAGILHEQPLCSSIILIISPRHALMKDQVSFEIIIFLP